MTSTAIEQARQTIGQYKGELVASLPTHLQEKGVGWLSSALAALRRDENLLKAANQNPGSLISALSEAAQKGLMPGTAEYYLTPRFGKNPAVVGITGFQGEVELMYRAGAVSSVIVENVFENDKFEYVPGEHDRPVHHIDWFGGNRGKLIGAYAYAIMKDGAVSKVVIVNQTRIDRAKEASSTADKSFSPWKSDEAAMWLKTAAHDLAKWVPTSAEYIREQVRAVRDVAAEPVPQQHQPQQQTPGTPASQPAATQPPTEPPVDEFADLGEQYIHGESTEDPPAPAQEATHEASGAQIRMIGALLGKNGHNTPDEKMTAVQSILGRDVDGLSDMNKREASQVIEALQSVDA